MAQPRTDDYARYNGDPPRLIGDATRIRNELGWTPRYADLDAILATAWRWHQRAEDRG